MLSPKRKMENVCVSVKGPPLSGIDPEAIITDSYTTVDHLVSRFRYIGFLKLINLQAK
jgi:hypothetical protein